MLAYDVAGGMEGLNGVPVAGKPNPNGGLCCISNGCGFIGWKAAAGLNGLDLAVAFGFCVVGCIDGPLTADDDAGGMMFVGNGGAG